MENNFDGISKYQHFVLATGNTFQNFRGGGGGDENPVNSLKNFKYLWETKQ